MNPVSLYKIQALFYALLALAFSLVFYPFYDGSDQFHYRLFYESIGDLSFREAFSLYRTSLGSSEPIYLLVVYLFNGLLSKDVLFSIINSILVYFSIIWCFKNKVSAAVIPLVLSGFYVFVLFFAAERLKLSALFFIIGAVVTGWSRYLFWGVSFFSHVQSLMLIFSSHSSFIVRLLFKRNRLIEYIYATLVVFFVFTMVFYLWDHIANKLSYYVSFGGFDSLVKPFLFFILTLFCAGSKKLEACIAIFPIFFVSYFLGDDRVVIFSYFIFLYYALKVRRGYNLPVFIVSIYFFIKGLMFLNKVYLYGSGFSAPV